MRWHHKFSLRLRSLFRKNKAELDLSEELAGAALVELHALVRPE